MAEYRIVHDAFWGYKVQVRRWWHYPFWLQAGINSFFNIEEAEEYARGHAKGFVKYLGKLS